MSREITVMKKANGTIPSALLVGDTGLTSALRASVQCEDKTLCAPAFAGLHCRTLFHQLILKTDKAPKRRPYLFVGDTGFEPVASCL